MTKFFVEIDAELHQKYNNNKTDYKPSRMKVLKSYFSAEV